MVWKSIEEIVFYSLYGFGLGKRDVNTVNEDDTSTQVPNDSQNYNGYDRGMVFWYCFPPFRTLHI